MWTSFSSESLCGEKKTKKREELSDSLHDIQGEQLMMPSTCHNTSADLSRTGTRE